MKTNKKELYDRIMNTEEPEFVSNVHPKNAIYF